MSNVYTNKQIFSIIWHDNKYNGVINGVINI